MFIDSGEYVRFYKLEKDSKSKLDFESMIKGIPRVKIFIDIICMTDECKSIMQYCVNNHIPLYTEYNDVVIYTNEVGDLVLDSPTQRKVIVEDGGDYMNIDFENILDN
jgi:hypothetical protein